MTSEAKIAANRRNAQRSTGPRSAAGKARSSRNAIRHGLAIPISRDATFAEGIAMLANEFCLSAGFGSQTAVIAAEAQFEVMRVRQTRTEILKKGRTTATEDINENTIARTFAEKARVLS